ncbi:MAG: M20 family metallo-hydrolase [Candidatus Micrarchaeota archaeon]|nr:M20 family metallo-hydrolase [Candidatus Micrarchaeota archaeon]
MATIAERVEGYREAMVKTLCDMIAIKAISPLSGGNGESARADFLGNVLKGWGFEVKRYDYKDESSVQRPNIVVKFGKARKTIWFIAHMDTVAEGDLTLWKTNPFKAVVKDGTVYGRGSLDNGQDLVAAMYALRVAKEMGISGEYNFGLALVADEELGSKYGIQKIIREGVFQSEDMFVVPDAGVETGETIEIAEKGILTMKVTVKGHQVHASLPELGKNAFRYSTRFLQRADELLHAKYDGTDDLLGKSTFEMTKHEKNVDSTNIIPGIDVSYIDCRVIPGYKLDDILADMNAIAKGDGFASDGVSIEVGVFNREDAVPKTAPDSEVAVRLSRCIKAVLGIEPRFVGIGGGTCAKFFREKGFPAVVWSKQSLLAHQPNEPAKVDDMVTDAKVFVAMLI